MMWGNAGRFRRERSANLFNASTSSSGVSGSCESESGASGSCESESAESDSSTEDDYEFEDNEDDIPQPQTLDIVRRSCNFGEIELSVSNANANLRGHDWNKARNISDIQMLSTSHTEELAGTFPLSLWRVLGAVLDESKVTQNKVLQAVSATLLSAPERKIWPKTREVIDKRLSKFGCISSRWTRTAKIDLTHITPTALQEPIDFQFIDPVVAWVTCAERLSRKHKLHFTYRALLNPETGEKLYGSSVQHGNIMLEACRRIPNKTGVRTGPALFGLSWDAGNASRRRSYTPILISVGNTDYSGLETCTCIGYLPVLSKRLKAEASQRADHELRQACAAAIIEIIDSAAKTGFKCLLSTGHHRL